MSGHAKPDCAERIAAARSPCQSTGEIVYATGAALEGDSASGLPRWIEEPGDGSSSATEAPGIRRECAELQDVSYYIRSSAQEDNVGEASG